MDASQYKDYVLVLLFMKYVSDKKDPLVELKEGTTFYDMLKYRGKPEIGDNINTIIGEFAKNNGLTDIITEADFEGNAKLGTGKDKIDLLTNLLNISINLNLILVKIEQMDMIYWETHTN